MSPSVKPGQRPNQTLVQKAWTYIKPVASKLRDILLNSLMGSQLHYQALDGGSISTTRPLGHHRYQHHHLQMPTLATRRTACTHLTMKRIYGASTCSICQRPSELGWIYVCTQDEGEACCLDEGEEDDARHFSFDEEEERQEDGEEQSQFTAAFRHMNTNPFAVDMSKFPLYRQPSAELNQWVQKAIEEGHYTADQIATLVAQKQSVVDNANEAVDRFHDEVLPSFFKKTKSSSPFKTSPFNNLDASLDLDECSSDTESIGKRRLNLYPVCQFRSCQICRPTFRDRAWQNFETVFEQDVGETLATESSDPDDHRPVPNASQMSKIGLRKPPARPPPRITRGRRRFRPFEDPEQRAGDGIEEGHRGSPPPETEPQDSMDVTDASTTEVSNDADESEGLHRSGTRLTPPIVIPSRGSSSPAAKRTKILRGEVRTRTRSRSPSPSSSMSASAPSHLNPLEEEMSLMGEKSEGEGEAVVVEEGMAVQVKEESVDLGSADIIMSV